MSRVHNFLWDSDSFGCDYILLLSSWCILLRRMLFLFWRMIFLFLRVLFWVVSRPGPQTILEFGRVVFLFLRVILFLRGVVFFFRGVVFFLRRHFPTCRGCAGFWTDPLSKLLLLILRQGHPTLQNYLVQLPALQSIWLKRSRDVLHN